MTPWILLLQEKPQNIRNVKLALPDCHIECVRTVDEAMAALGQRRYSLIISAVHLEYDGSVFDFLKLAKGHPATSRIPFVFYCSQTTTFARSVRDGLQIAARALGVDKYITMEDFDPTELRAEFLDYLDHLPAAAPTSLTADAAQEEDLVSDNRV